MPHEDARRAGPWQESGPQKIATTTSNTIVCRATVTFDEDTIGVRGPGVFQTLRPHDFRPIMVGARHGGAWVVDRTRRGADRLPDLLAALDAAGFRVTVTEAGEQR